MNPPIHLPSEASTTPLPPEGVTPEAWAAIGAVWDEGEWRIPERNAQGEVVGTARRFADGQKGFVTGGKRGLVMAWPLPPYAGTSTSDPVVVCEGASDTAAGVGLGLTCIGKPSATCGNDLAAELLADRHVMIMVDNDAAGDSGAERLVKRLADAASVRRVLPPAGVKDLRAWVVSGATRETVLDAYRAAAPEVIAPHSIRVSIERGRARIEWCLTPVTQLAQHTEPPWLWRPYLAPGATTLLTGQWKSGKSTLLSELLLGITTGTGLCAGATPTTVAVLSEEANGHWARRRDALGLGAKVLLCHRAKGGRPDRSEWEKLCEQLGSRVAQGEVGAVVVDTLAAFWPAEEENDAGEVTRALAPLKAITSAGAALLLIHHPRKQALDSWMSARGSGVLSGFPDVLIEFGRYPAASITTTQRLLKCVSRYPDAPPEAILNFEGGRYVMAGTPEHVGSEALAERVLAQLPSQEPGVSTKDLLAGWNPGPPPAQRVVERVLGGLVEDLKVHVAGGGVRGDPRRYRRTGFDSRTATSIEARIECARGERPASRSDGGAA